MNGSPANPRRINERALMRRLLDSRLPGPAHAASSDAGVPRSELARATGLSVPTVGKVVAGMAAAGWLEEVAVDDSPDAAPGRPAKLVRLNRAVRRLLVIQLGVRHTRLAILPVAGPRDEGWATTFRTPAQAKEWQTALRQAARSLAISEPWCVALSLPGVVDEAAGRVLLSPNLHWTEGADFPALLGELWPVPLCAVQEIRALAMGHVAAEPGQRDFLLVDFGAGVGAAAVIDGRLYQSTLPMSGEIGHAPVAGNRRPCGCGAKGCLETLLSRRGLRQSFARHQRQKRVTWKTLFRHVEQHGVEAWLAESLNAAAGALAGALNLLGLRHVVVTGSLAELPTGVLDHFRTVVRSAAMWGRFGEVTMLAAPRCRAAGLVAAAMDRVLLPDPSIVNHARQTWSENTVNHGSRVDA